jgi:hypothetical protein
MGFASLSITAQAGSRQAQPERGISSCLEPNALQRMSQPPFALSLSKGHTQIQIPKGARDVV